MCLCVSAGPSADTYGYTHAFMIPLVHVGIQLFSKWLPSLLAFALILFLYQMYLFIYLFITNIQVHIGLFMYLNIAMQL